MAGTGQPGRTAGIGHLRQDSWDKAVGTGQPGQESRDRRAGTGNSEIKTGQYSQDNNRPGGLDRRAWQNRVNKSVHDSKARTETSGSQEWTAGTGQPEKTVGIVYPGQETEDKTTRTGQQGLDS
jgi:hypothetical protein